MLANKILAAQPVSGKSPEAIATEWDRIAHIRHKQISGGSDISFNYVLKPTILGLLKGCDLSKVIDLGCGTGELTRDLSLISSDITGVDSSSLSTAIAEETCANSPNISLFSGSVEAFARRAYGSRFKTAVANMTLMTCLDLDSFVESVAEVVADQGYFIATITHPCYWPTYWGYADAEWFDYRKEIVIEAPFRISAEATDYVTTHVHRPLSAYAEVLERAGFLIERILEPYPDKDVQSMYPAQWSFPRFLAFRAVLNSEQEKPTTT